MNDEFVPPSTNEYMSVYSPTDSTNEIGKVAVSGCDDVNQAVGKFFFQVLYVIGVWD